MPKSSLAYLSPLRAFIERSEELSKHGVVDVEDVLGRRLADLLQCRDGVGDHHRIGVRNHVAQLLQETLLLHQLFVDVIPASPGTHKPTATRATRHEGV